MGDDTSRLAVADRLLHALSTDEYRPTWRSDITPDDQEALREVARSFRERRFTANDVLAEAMSRGTSDNAADIAACLTDLENRGEIRRVGESDPPEWEFAQTV